MKCLVYSDPNEGEAGGIGASCQIKTRLGGGG